MEVKQKFNSAKLISINSLLQIFFGSIFLALMAQVSFPLPFSPVPITLQTLGVALLAITLGSKKAPLAVLCYLTEATLGFPVLAGGVSKPLWMFGTNAGYLVGFVFASYIIAKLLESKVEISFPRKFASILIGEATLLILGCLWLSVFLGALSAISLGLLPFLPGAMVKGLVAATSIQPIEWVKSKAQHYLG